MINRIKRSEIEKWARILGYPDGLGYNTYMSQIVRDYPEVEIINDFLLEDEE